ncbi:MAG TPA: cell division protein ZapA [Burkholderiaceae bacterium]|nr:cell division protein ZapA [Burkholderiaceae bacterium]
MEQITLSILGREYRVACRPEERNELLACAHYVDQKMTAIRDGGKVLGTDRVAVMAALQIAQELFGSKGNDGAVIADVRRRLRDLTALADEILAPQEKLF